MNQIATGKFRTLTIGLVIAFCLFYASFVYATVSNTQYSVGQTTYNLFTVGATTFNQMVVGDYNAPAATTTPVDDYYGFKALLLFLPGILLLCFVIWFFYLGFQHIKQSEVLIGLTYFTISFVLVGVTTLIAMPLILGAVEATIWFK